MALDVQYSLGVDNSQLVAELRRARREFATVGTAAKESARQIGDQWGALRNRVAGVFAGIGLGALAIEAVKTDASFQALATTLRFASGSQAEYARNSAFLRQQVSALGLDLMGAGKAFVSLTAAARGTTLEGEGVRSIFDAVSKAGTVMMLSSEQQQGALLAIQQMMSKGTVQAEELRGQLGERLPGAFQIAARSMKMSTAELGKALEQGLVESAEFLPRFAAQLRREMSVGVEGAAQSVQAEFGRLQSAKAEAMAALSNSDFAKAAAKGLAEFLSTVKDVLTKSNVDANEWATDIADTVASVADTFYNLGLAVEAIGNTMGFALSAAKRNLDNFWNADPKTFFREFSTGAEDWRAEMARIGAKEDPFTKAIAARRAAARAAAADPELRKLARMDADRQRNADDALLGSASKLGRGKKADTTAARASDRLLDEIRKRSALAQEELDGREKLTEAERFAVVVKDALADSENKLSSSMRASIEAALQSYLAQAQQIEQRKQSIDLARVQNQLFDDELRSLNGIEQAKNDMIAANREAIEAMQDELRLLTMTRQEQEKYIQLKRLDATIGDALRRIDEEVVAAQESGDAGAARRLAGQRAEVLQLAADMRGKLTRAIEARYAAERDGMLGIKAAAAEYVDAANNRFAQLRDLTSNVFRGLEDTLTEFVTTGKANFADLSRYAIAEITRIAIIKPLLQDVANSMRGIGGGSGLFGSLVGAFFGGGGDSGMPDDVPTRGGRRFGGGVERGGLYEVNEDGTELLSQNGRDYLMVGATGGRVSPLGVARQQPAGGNLSVKIINSAGAKVSTQERRDDSGNMSVDVLVEAVERRMGERVDSGLGLAGNVGRRFGLNSSAGLMR